MKLNGLLEHNNIKGGEVKMGYYYKKVQPSIGETMDFTLDLRETDKKEARAFLGLEPMEALSLSLKDSDEAWAVMHDDEYVGFFGVCQGDGYGIPWFVSTDDFDDFKLTFVKESKKILQSMLEKYGKLQNYVSVENEKSINWLKWLGFTIHPLEVRFHDPDVFFYKFTKEVD